MAYLLDLMVANKMGSIVSCMLDLDLCIVVVVVVGRVVVVGMIVVGKVVAAGKVFVVVVVVVVADNFDNFESDNWMVFDGMTD